MGKVGQIIICTPTPNVGYFQKSKELFGLVLLVCWEHFGF